MHVLRFVVGDAAYAVEIDRVVEVAPRVAISPLPDVPSFIEGVFSYRRATCIAVSLRRRFAHPPRRPSLDEHIIVVKGRKRLLGLVVDRADVDAVIADVAIEEPAAGTKLVSGVVPLADGVLLVHDVDALLTDDDEATIDRSLLS